MSASPTPSLEAGTSLPVSAIKIGIRHRRDMGDIAALAQSIAEVGLLHPIVVKPDGQLIAGERRLLAYGQLGHDQIPVTMVDIDQIHRGEYAENYFRKAFTPSEMVAITAVLEPSERAKAKERMVAAHVSPGKFPEQAKGAALDHVARIVGKDRKTIAKAREVCAAAESDPARFGKLVADMDRTGRVDGPFKRLKVTLQAEAIRAEPPPYPGNGSYRVVAADPPWPYDPSRRATHPYPQMSIADIYDIAPRVQAIVHQDCILWLWVTNHHMREGLTVLDAWGFEHKTILTWFKDKLGYGGWLRGQTEHCLMAVRGDPVVNLTNQTTVLNGPVRANSQKPEEFYKLVEALCPAPRYAELFARSEREGWDGHGNEVQP